MKATYSTIQHSPRVELPPEMLERVYMYCTAGGLSAREIRKLYPAGVLLGMDGMTDREIVQNALINGLRPALPNLRPVVSRVEISQASFS